MAVHLGGSLHTLLNEKVGSDCPAMTKIDYSGKKERGETYTERERERDWIDWHKVDSRLLESEVQNACFKSCLKKEEKGKTSLSKLSLYEITKII